MKSSLLIPSRYKLIGFILFLPCMVVGLLNVYKEFQFGFLSVRGSRIFDFSDGNLTNELALSGVIIGLLMIAFAREKTEDEFIHRLRLESWQWAILINYALLFIANWVVYGTEYLQVMIYNMLTTLIIFIIRFHWLLARYKKQLAE